MQYNLALAAAAILLAGAAVTYADVTLVQDGKSNCIIHVADRVMQDDRKVARSPEKQYLEEENRRRLRESVRDLAHYLGRMTGAEVGIEAGAPAADEKRVVILVGELATARFGEPGKKMAAGQGYRIVVQPAAVGLIGEGDLGTSYAIYTLLHDLGCRWYIPGELGEVIPQQKTIALKEQDLSATPHTLYRSLWYGGDDFKRRNRQGGLYLSCGHALEHYITEEQRNEHPEWRATINGKPHKTRLKWSSQGVADAIADRIIKRVDETGEMSISLSPDDGAEFDESPEDKALDAGDWDTTLDQPSLTDRLVVLCNRIAERVTKKHPEVMFGVLAYVQYTRPPVREKLHPNIVPQIAPITYRRAHSMIMEGVPDNEAMRYLVEGWAKASPMVSHYWYGWFLAEASAPNPYLTKWGDELPIVFANKCAFWMPETTANFETTMHALYLGMRMSWDPSQKPQAIYDEINQRFYGHAADAMAAYWNLVDRTWIETPEYSGCGFGHMRRFPPEKLAQWRQAMDKALAACQTVTEYRRVKMAEVSLGLFELFMKMRRDLADGRFASLKNDMNRYNAALTTAAHEYENNAAFTLMGWTRPETLNHKYFRAFYGKTYEDAGRIADARAFTSLTPKPLRQFRWQVDKEKVGEAQGWSKPDHDDKAWKTTDPCLETWSSLGHHAYMGSMWYRTNVKLPAVPAGKRTYLWLSSTDGSAKVYVNGKHCPWTNDKGETVEAFSGYCQPASVDITDAIKAGDNQVTLLCTRQFVNELGTGGLLGPVTIYRQK